MAQLQSSADNPAGSAPRRLRLAKAGPPDLTDLPSVHDQALSANSPVRMHWDLGEVARRHQPPIWSRDTRATRAPDRADEPYRSANHQHLRSRVPGHRPVLPAGRRRLETEPAGMGRFDLPAQDAGRQARLDGHENGPQVQGQDRDTARAAYLLRGQRGTGRQETTGRQVRRDPADTAEESG